MGTAAGIKPSTRPESAAALRRARSLQRCARPARPRRDRARRRPRPAADPQLRQPHLLTHVHRPLSPRAPPLVLDGTLRQPRQDRPLPETTSQPGRSGADVVEYFAEFAREGLGLTAVSEFAAEEAAVVAREHGRLP